MSYPQYNHSYRRNRILEPAQLYASSDIFHPTADQKYMLGCIFECNDGRMFRYCKAAAAAITRARMVASCLAPPELEEETQAAATAMAVGDRVVDVTVTTSSGIADHDLIDGTMWVNASDTDDSTIGDSYIIKDNKWVTSDTIVELKLADAGGIRQAISATDDVSIVKNRCRDVVVKPASLAAACIGIPLVDIPASYYFWVQYRGIAPIIIDADATVVIGGPIGIEDTSPAEGSGGVVGDDGSDMVWGTCVSAEDASEISLVDLLLP